MADRDLAYLKFYPRARQNRVMSVILAAFCLTGIYTPLHSQQPSTNPIIGTVESVSGATISVQTDAGAAISATISNSAQFLRIAPGERSLAGAVNRHKCGGFHRTDIHDATRNEVGPDTVAQSWAISPSRYALSSRISWSPPVPGLPASMVAVPS
jgi:hypothetical protein